MNLYTRIFIVFSYHNNKQTVNNILITYALMVYDRADRRLSPSETFAYTADFVPLRPIRISISAGVVTSIKLSSHNGFCHPVPRHHSITSTLYGSFAFFLEVYPSWLKRNGETISQSSRARRPSRPSTGRYSNKNHLTSDFPIDLTDDRPVGNHRSAATLVTTGISLFPADNDSYRYPSSDT